MSKELDAKWLELVAAGNAEWSPGMLGPDGFRVVSVRQDSRGFQVVSRGCGWTAPSLQSDFVPDWSDPATLGCLLGLVEARYGAPVSVWYTHDGECSIRVGRLATAGGRWFSGPAKAEVVLRALEVAP